MIRAGDVEVVGDDQEGDAVAVPPVAQQGEDAAAKAERLASVTVLLEMLARQPQEPVVS
jgi:hypothetical protein